MTGPELLQRREALGLSQAALAEILGVESTLIAAWEGASRLPASIVKRIEWSFAFEAQQLALVAAGHPPCPIAEGIFTVMKKDGDTFQRQVARAETHARTCDACQARSAVIATMPPLPLPPLPLSARVLVALNEQFQRLPVWLRPAAWGAVFIGGATLFRTAVLLLISPRSFTLKTGLSVLAAVGIGAYGGAIGGATYSVVRPRTRALGRAGDYLTGLACAYAYFVALFIPFSYFSDDPRLRQPISYGIFFVTATFFGLVIGHSWFKMETPPDEGVTAN